MRLKGTTQFVSAVPLDSRWSQSNTCPHCDEPITNDALTCKRCVRRMQVNREKFEKRAATLSHGDVLALTAAQMDRARELLGWREVTG